MEITKYCKRCKKRTKAIWRATITGKPLKEEQYKCSKCFQKYQKK